MKKQDPLFELIKSLSKSEKRYFTLFASQHVIGDKNNYLKLYEAMEAQSSFEPAAFKSQFKSEPFLKHFSYEKNYLFKLIMKSMRAYHGERRVENKIWDLMQDARFLEDRGQYDSAQKHLQKAAKTAEVHEKFTLLLEIGAQERRLLKASTLLNMQTKLEANIQQKDKLLLQVENAFAYLDTHDKIFLLNRQSAHLDQVEISTMLKPLEIALDSLEPQSLLAQLNYHAAKALIHRSRREYGLAQSQFLHTLAIWETHLAWQQENPSRYITCIANCLAMTFQLQKYAEVPELLNKLRSFPTRTFDESAEAFQNISFFELLLALNLADIEGGLSLLPDINKGLKRYGGKINKARQLSIWMNLALLYLLAQQPKNALQWVNRILNDERSEHRRDVQAYARIFMLILHWELGNYDVLETQIRNYRSYLKKKGELTRFETISLTAFKFELSQIGQSSAGQGWAHAIQSFKEANTPRLGYQETILWFSAQIKQIPIGKLWKEQAESTAPPA